MGQHSRIEWTDHTFNPCWGCTKISPGCDHCYAHAWDRRLGGAHWGATAPRRVMSDAYWRQPRRWNATSHPEGRPWRVFCASMADVFDKEAPPGQRERLWALIRATPNTAKRRVIREEPESGCARHAVVIARRSFSRR
jgi:protein gp37